jgi:hypothetical protein
MRESGGRKVRAVMAVPALSGSFALERRAQDDKFGVVRAARIRTAFDTGSGAEVYTGLSVLTEETQPILQ